MLDIWASSRNVNTLLTKLEIQFRRAQRSLGIKPDLRNALPLVRAANDTLTDLARCVQDLEAAGVSMPPDVIVRLNACNQELRFMAYDIAQCQEILAHRERCVTEKLSVLS